MGTLLTILCVVAVMLGIPFTIVVLVGRAEKRKRRELMTRLAERLGYGFTENPGYTLADRYGALPRIAALGKEAKARNLVHGERGGIGVRIFNYSGVRQPSCSYEGVVVLELPGREFPAFLLRPEGLADKVAAAFGRDDIDFEENEEFSKRYYVSSSDEGFARKLLNERQMEMLLAMDDIRIEMGGSAIAFYVEQATLPALEQLHGLAWRFVGNMPDLAPDTKAGEERAPSGRRASASRKIAASKAASLGKEVLVVGIVLFPVFCMVAMKTVPLSGWPLGILLAAVLTGVAAVVGYASWLGEKRRRDGMAGMAARLGYRFTSRPRPELLRAYSFLPLFPVRKGAEAKNLIHGERDGTGVRIFDYHCPRRDHPIGAVLLEMPGRDFPPFRLRRELPTDRIAAAAGFEDIDFESDEFSRKYYVTCRDRRFAFDVITARQMEMLLTLDDINIEIGRHAMAFYLERAVSPAEIEWLHGVAWRFVGNILAFVFERKSGEGDAPSATTR